MALKPIDFVPLVNPQPPSPALPPYLGAGSLTPLARTGRGVGGEGRLPSPVRGRGVGGEGKLPSPLNPRPPSPALPPKWGKGA